MIDLKLEEYLEFKSSIITFIEDIKKIELNEEIYNFVSVMYEYIRMKNNIAYKSFQNLSIYLNNIEKHINIYDFKSDVISLLIELYRDLIFLNNINVYYLGKDFPIYINDSYTNIKIKKVSSIDEVNIKHKTFSQKEYNILLVESNEYINVRNDLFDKVYIYNDMINQITDLSNKIYMNDYNYYFLKHEFESAKKEECNTLIVGNSYPLVGIDKKLLDESAFNLSMHSQDLYYSYKLAKECITLNKSIKRCIIGVGYYLTYHDLSLGTSDYSKFMVKNIYMPILNDKHNSEYVEESTNLRINDFIKEEVISSIFKIENIHEKMTYDMYKKNDAYFNVNNNRVGFYGNTSLSDINKDNKIKLGKERAMSHNNLIKYSKTDSEFSEIMEGFIKFLNDKGVEPVIVVFPSTRYYSEYLDKRYIEKFYKTIDILKEKCYFKLIDFNTEDIFEDSDFIDMDHLGEKGCVKVSEYLNLIK